MFIRTDFSHNYGSTVVQLFCENSNDLYAYSDLILHNGNAYEDIEVSATAGGAILSTHSNITIVVTKLSTNHTSNTYQYLIHPNCPFDYCHPPSSRVGIHLNIPNGADTQCANHCRGLLCGECQYNFSLSLGNSHCLPCSTHWYMLSI